MRTIKTYMGGGLSSNSMKSPMDPRRVLEYMMGGKSKMYQQGGGVTGGEEDQYTRDAQARNWFLNYMNSPQYKRMLAESGARGSQDVSDIDALRRSQLASLPPTIFDESVGSGQYYPDTHDIYINPEAGTDVTVHELSHSTDNMFNDETPRLGLPRADMDMIMSMTDPMFKDYIPRFNRYLSKKRGARLPFERLSDVEEKIAGTKTEAEMRQLMDLIRRHVDSGNISEREGHKLFMSNASPHEVRARLNAARYIAQDEDIYDPFTETPTMEDVSKLLKLYDSNPEKYFQLKWMKAYQSPEQILQLLQSVSDNPNTQQEQYPRA